MNCARELEIIKILAAQAGAVLLQFRNDAAGQVGRNRSSGEVVSLAALVADDLIRSGLADAFPDDSLCSRLSGREAGWTGRVWLVDSLDGEQDFLAGGDQFTVSIGLAIHGRPVLGVVFNPLRQEMFAGGIRLGATLNNRPLPGHASSIEIGKSIVVPQAEWQDTAALCQPHLNLLPTGNLSYSMARVAAGWEGGLLSLLAHRGCSTCPGAALVEAAGGRVTLLDGSDLLYVSDEMVHGTGILAAAPSRHAQVLAMLRNRLDNERLRDAA